MADSSNTFTNKELLLKIYDLNVNYTQHITETNEKMKNLTEKVDSHEVILQKLSSVPEKIDDLSNSVKDLKDSQCKQNEKMEKRGEEMEKRIEELENRSGKTALNIWKQVGAVVLGALLSLIVGVVFSMLFGGTK